MQFAGHCLRTLDIALGRWTLPMPLVIVWWRWILAPYTRYCPVALDIASWRVSLRCGIGLCLILYYPLQMLFSWTIRERQPQAASSLHAANICKMRRRNGKHPSTWLSYPQMLSLATIIITMTTVMTWIDSPRLFFIFGVINGDSIRGGFNRGGLINFARKGLIFVTFSLSKCMLFYAA